MIITGSAIFIKAGAGEEVVKKLKSFPEVTFHVISESGTELVVNLEVEDDDGLDRLCDNLKLNIPQIVDISHLSVNFEGMLDRIDSGELTVRKPKFGRIRD